MALSDEARTTPNQRSTRNSATAYAQVLGDAVAVLTAAARLTWIGDRRDGTRSARSCDWAEFVSLALAGAAANMGSVESVLAGRPGSWEADTVRTLLRSTVGPDEQQLLAHRTEPVVVNINVDDQPEPACPSGSHPGAGTRVRTDRRARRSTRAAASTGLGQLRRGTRQPHPSPRNADCGAAGPGRRDCGRRPDPGDGFRHLGQWGGRFDPGATAARRRRGDPAPRSWSQPPGAARAGRLN